MSLAQQIGRNGPQRLHHISLGGLFDKLFGKCVPLLVFQSMCFVAAHGQLQVKSQLPLKILMFCRYVFARGNFSPAVEPDMMLMQRAASLNRNTANGDLKCFMGWPRKRWL